MRKMTIFLQRLTFLLVLLLLLYNCKALNKANVSDTTCFQRVSGSNNEDTSVVQLVITDDKVEGQFYVMPEGKDWRIGTINGIKKDSIITATWTFIQEGVQNTLPVEFKLTNDKLYERDFSVDNIQRNISPEDYFITEYVKMDCANFSIRKKVEFR